MREKRRSQGHGRSSPRGWSDAQRASHTTPKETTMSIYVTVRARLKSDPASSKALHDEVTRATKDMAVQAGDVGHLIYLGGQDARDFLGIDEWKSAEAFQAFASN